MPRSRSGEPAGALEEISRDLDKAARANIEFQKAITPYKRWERSIEKSRCIATSEPRSISDSACYDAPSNHARLSWIMIETKRNDALMRALDRLMGLPFVYASQPDVSVSLGATVASGPTVAVRIDGFDVHRRPVSPAYFSKRLGDLIECMKAFPASEPRRTWLLSGHRLSAGSPEAAIWKFLAFQERSLIWPLVGDGANRKPNAALRKKVKEMSLFEIFEARDAMEQAISTLREAPA